MLSLYVHQISESFEYQKILITGCRDMDKKNARKWGFPPFVTPKIIFQKSGSVTFVPSWCPNFMQKTRNTNELSVRYLKTDTHTRTHGHGPLRVNPGSKKWSTLNYGT